MTHICHINTTFNSRAGSARRTFSILRSLADSGYRVSLIAGRDFAPDNRWNFKGIDVYRLPSLTKYINLRTDIQCLFNLVCLLRKLQPDLVHTHLAKAGFQGRLAAWLTGIPVVVHTVHGPTFAHSMSAIKRVTYTLLERFSSLYTDHFIFVGNELMEYYKRYNIGTEDNSFVIHTGRFRMNTVYNFSVDKMKDFRIENNIDPGCLLMLSVGRLVPYKQQEHSILALDALRKRGINAELIIAGEALLSEEQNYRYYLLDLVEELDLGRFVHFFGFCENVFELMIASDVLVLTSKYEGLPNIVIEATLLGRTIASYDIMGVKEVLDPEYSRVVRPDDIDELVEAIAGLAGNTKSFESDISQNKLKLRRFSIEHMLSSKLAFYEKVFAKTRIQAGTLEPVMNEALK